MRRCRSRMSTHPALQFHLCGLSHPEQPILLEKSHHVQLLGLRGIEETQCLGCLASTGPLQGEEGEVATYDRPGLEFETAWVPSFSLGLVQISKRLVCSAKSVHDQSPLVHG